MKKALILIGDAAGGHMSCARALKEGFENTQYKAVIRTVKSYDDIYLSISRYKVLENIFNYFSILVNRSSFVNYIFSKYFILTLSNKTKKILIEEKPDLVISNHSMTALAIGAVRKHFNFKFVVTVPDLITVARLWIECKPDLLLSPTNGATEILREYDQDVPILEGYYPLRGIKKYSEREVVEIKESLFKELGFDTNIPTVLITGCGFGTRAIVNKMSDILKKDKYQFIILVGKDEKLKKELHKRYLKNKHVFINGYTDKMLDFFSSCDIVIAKPGPATVLEIEKIGKKAIFTQPVGYQEWGNVEYLKNNPNFRYVGGNFIGIEGVLGELLSSDYVSYSGGIKNAKQSVSDILKTLSV